MGEKIAAGPGQGAAAGEKWRLYSAQTAHSHEAAWRKLRRVLRARGGKALRFTVDIRPLAAALRDPAVVAHALGLVVQCAESALFGGDHQCHGCLAAWRPARSIAGVALVDFIDAKGAGGIVGLCTECWRDPALLTIVTDGFRRDFGLTSADIRVLSGAGRA